VSCLSIHHGFDSLDKLDDRIDDLRDFGLIEPHGQVLLLGVIFSGRERSRGVNDRIAEVFGWGRIEGRRLGAHILPHPDTGEPQIDLYWLLDDFTKGWMAYLGAVSAGTGTDIARNFVARFDELFHD